MNDDRAAAVTTREPASQPFPDLRYQQRKADAVCEKARRQQQCPGHENHGAVGELLRGHDTSDNRRLQRRKLGASLAGNEPCAGNRSNHHDDKRRDDSDPVANGEKQGDFEDRGHDEQDEEGLSEPHEREDTQAGNLRHMELRDLPRVDSLAADVADLLPYPLPAPMVVEAARAAVEEARAAIVAGGDADPAQIALAALAPLATSRPRTVLNATGVLLHTNLGRAPLSPAAAAAAADHAVGYQNLEIDLATGARGGRGDYVGRLLQTLTGAEAALVVNNNAGALLLALAALSGGKRVLVSRGELIEIGGSFRLPNLMAASGAELVEVGTTNRTRLADYESEAEGAAAILKVHPSNYRVEGFTEEVGYAALATLARDCGVPFIADIGSGLLDERAPWLAGPPPAWLRGEPGAVQTIDLGATVAIFSGDKLLGGPQAGIAVGTADAIYKMRKHPIARAVRIDGPTQTALIETLELYATGRGNEVPFWAMASMSEQQLTARSETVAKRIGPAAAVIASHSVPGAGSVPGEMIPSPAIRISGNADVLWQALIMANPPILARRKEGSLELDLRTLPQAEDDRVASLIAQALT